MLCILTKSYSTVYAQLRQRYMAQKFDLTGTVADDCIGQRLDQTLAKMFSDFSRSRIQGWINDGRVTVDDNVITKGREKVLGGEHIRIAVELEDDTRFQAEAIDLDIVYQDDAIMVINKPAGLVVHPGAGVKNGTLLNALLYHDPDLAEVPRAGIVHRLDKDTTGLMVVARTVQAQTALVTQLQARAITREYEAVVLGVMTAGGLVDEPIARHPQKRVQMAVHPTGKEAVTHYRVAERFRAHTLIRCRLETGRTHQIRVHMAYIHHPLVGDPVYLGRRQPAGKVPDYLQQCLRRFTRQALHARYLELEHPVTGERMNWHAATPDDMVELIDLLRKDTAENGFDD